MMTIVTRIEIAEGEEPAWDAAMRERVNVAKTQPGFVSVQLCIPADDLNERVVIGTWQTRADWEAWHETSVFSETRQRMDRSEVRRNGEWWQRFEIAVPPDDEQLEIVRRVNRLLEMADGLRRRTDAASRRIDRSVQAVLAKAIRGDFDNDLIDRRL